VQNRSPWIGRPPGRPAGGSRHPACEPAGLAAERRALSRLLVPTDRLARATGISHPIGHAVTVAVGPWTA